MPSFPSSEADKVIPRWLAEEARLNKESARSHRFALLLENEQIDSLVKQILD